MSESQSGLSMKAKTRSVRGRPVGTGIDDRERLDAITALLAGNPSLKPTTAIKALGISDPSVIRRLRDKLKTYRSDALPAPGAAAEREARVQSMAAAADNVRPFRIKEDVPPKRDAPIPEPEAPKNSRHPAYPTLLPLIELTIGTWSAAFALQQAMLGALLQNPVIRTALKQHIAGNELMLSLLKVPVSPRRTV